MRSGLVLCLLIVLCASASAATAAQVHRHHATVHSARGDSGLRCGLGLFTGTAGPS